MVAVAIACLPVFLSGHRISRWEGLAFLAYYVAYTAYLVLASLAHASLETYARVMWMAVSPLTGLTLVVVMVCAVRERGQAAVG